MKATLLGCIIGISMAVGQAQSPPVPYTFVTFAGSPEAGYVNGPLDVARFKSPRGLALDDAGVIYVTDAGNHTVRKIRPDGLVSTVAGLAGNPGSTDGTGESARFRWPSGIVVGPGHNLYVADSYNETIRVITPEGVVSTLAGRPGVWGHDDGTGTGARFWQPEHVALASDGTLLVAEGNNCAVRKVTFDGVVTAFAGQPRFPGPGSADGVGTAAQFLFAFGVAVDPAGTIYVSDHGNHTIRKITPAAEVTTLAGKAEIAGSADGAGANARFRLPAGLAVDQDGGVFVADFSNQTIRKVSAAGEVVTVAGLAETAGETDGTGAGARFHGPIAVMVDQGGNLYVAEYWKHRIRKGWRAVAPVLGGRPVTTADGSLQLTVTGAAGSRYVVQASTDVQEWLSVTNCTSTSETVTVTVPGPKDSSLRFYRAVLE